MGFTKQLNRFAFQMRQAGFFEHCETETAEPPKGSCADQRMQMPREAQTLAANGCCIGIPTVSNDNNHVFTM